MENYIILAVLILVVGLASGYICIRKKQGARCIGCPNGNACKGGCCGAEKKP